VTDTFRYDVWGDLAERTGNTPTPHQFVGALGYEREADSGLIFIGTRYYDPSVGRFLSQDAAQWGVNWYVYAANNPAGAIDANGNSPLLVAGLIGAAVGGFIGGVGAYLNGGDVWKGIGQGIVVGGVAGLTGGFVGGIVGGTVSGAVGGGATGGFVGGIVGGFTGGAVGNAIGQGAAIGLGWRESFSWGQLWISGAIGGIFGGIMTYPRPVPSTLYHYTNTSQQFTGGGFKPGWGLYGNGSYFTNIPPEQMTWWRWLMLGMWPPREYVVTVPNPSPSTMPTIFPGVYVYPGSHPFSESPPIPSPLR
jgi:RHS repeat-associated protein